MTTEKRKILVLVVDDVEDNREIYKLFLSFKGLQVALASDGEEALAKAVELMPDLILMDLNLPLMNGTEATRRLKRNPKTQHIPIVALTAHSESRVAEEARKVGCAGILVKPCLADGLFDEISRILGLNQP